MKPLYKFWYWSETLLFPHRFETVEFTVTKIPTVPESVLEKLKQYPTPKHVDYDPHLSDADRLRIKYWLEKRGKR